MAIGFVAQPRDAVGGRSSRIVTGDAEFERGTAATNQRKGISGQLAETERWLTASKTRCIPKTRRPFRCSDTGRHRRRLKATPGNSRNGLARILSHVSSRPLLWEAACGMVRQTQMNGRSCRRLARARRGPHRCRVVASHPDTGRTAIAPGRPGAVGSVVADRDGSRVDGRRRHHHRDGTTGRIDCRRPRAYGLAGSVAGRCFRPDRTSGLSCRCCARGRGMVAVAERVRSAPLAGGMAAKLAMAENSIRNRERGGAAVGPGSSGSTPDPRLRSTTMPHFANATHEPETQRS